jgi:hypothetical protein
MPPAFSVAHGSGTGHAISVAVSNDLAEITSGTSKIRASNARFAFASNSVDITAFYSVHQHFVKATTGKVRRHVYILNKATYVLVASLWEAYCEDVVAESMNLLIDHVPTWKKLPHRLARDVAKEVRHADTALLVPWELAGDGWRQYLKDRQDARAYERNYDFSGPKSANIERFFGESLGLPRMRDIWRNTEGAEVCKNLDNHLDRRNIIIHQISPGPTVYKRDVKAFYNVVRCLVRRTDQVIDQMLTNATGESRWTSYVKSGPVDIGYRYLQPEADTPDTS